MDPDLEKQVQALAAEQRRLTEELASIADFSAEVHDQAAAVHDRLKNPLLDPAQLRAHAEADRELAADERRRLQAAQEDQPEG